MAYYSTCVICRDKLSLQNMLVQKSSHAIGMVCLSAQRMGKELMKLFAGVLHHYRMCDCPEHFYIVKAIAKGHAVG